MPFPRLHNELVSERAQELIISDFQTVLSQWPCDPVTSKASLHTLQASVSPPHLVSLLLSLLFCPHCLPGSYLFARLHLTCPNQAPIFG